MTSDKSRRVEIKDEDKTIAAAEVTPLDDDEGTVRASLHPASGAAPQGSRASLVDAIVDLPEVRASPRLEATVPLGDTESLDRLRERREGAVTHPSGSTALVDADTRPARITQPGEEPEDEEPASLPPAALA
jgi:hypothetical protein